MGIAVTLSVTVRDKGGFELDGTHVPLGAVERRVQFLTQGDGRVCPQCLPYHGTVHDLDESDRPTPPLHHKCRCEERWFVDGVSEPERPMGARLRELLAPLSNREAEKFLGRGRFRLLEERVVTIEQMVDGATGQLRSLTDLVETFKIPEPVLQRLGITQVRAS